MNSKEFIAKLQKVVDAFNTVYMWGVFGSPVTESVISSKAKQYPNWYTQSRQTEFRELIAKGYFGFDCVNLIKGILWGWSGDKTKTYGGAMYASNGVPDVNADGMIGKCLNVSTDFSTIIPGEAVWMQGHIGVYIGEGKVVECTPRWENGAQITACWNIGTIAGMNGRKWTKHGKLPYVTYEPSTIMENDIPASASFAVGNIVNFTGGTHYISAYTETGKVCKPGKAKITQIAKGTKHPYHLIREIGGGSTVYGWVDADCITENGEEQNTESNTAAEQTMFIEKIGAMATEDMKKSRILASLTIAQAILESAWGKSGLATTANNLFGIKGSYNGAYYSSETQEWTGEKYITITAQFRKYPSWAESIADHSGLFNKLDRYSNLRGLDDYRLACRYVREDGYATDPEYTNKLVSIIERYNLTKFDVKMEAPQPPQETQNTAKSLNTGEVVQFTGGNVYLSSNAATAATTKPASKCKITNIYNGKHPYHLISQDGKGVYGWVDTNCIASEGAQAKAPEELKQGCKVQYSGKLYRDSYGGGPGKTVNGTYIVSRHIPGRKCGVLLGSVGWVPESDCKVIA